MYFSSRRQWMKWAKWHVCQYHQDEDVVVRALDELAPAQTIWGRMWTSLPFLTNNVYASFFWFLLRVNYPIKYRKTEYKVSQKKWVSEICSHLKNSGPPGEVGSKRPCWAILGLLGHSAPSGPFWAILGPLGHSGPSGYFWAIWPFLALWAIWTLWAILVLFIAIFHMRGWHDPWMIDNAFEVMIYIFLS